MTSFWDRVKTIFLAMIASGGVSYGTTQYTAPKPAPAFVTVPGTGSGSIATLENRAFMSKSEQRKASKRWGELTQKEVDTLTADLKKSGMKESVVVYCLNDDFCGDMQLDLVNAFGSAKWDVDMQTPLLDDTKGIGVSDEIVASVIRSAIPRLPVTIIPSPLKDKVVISVGKR